MLATYFHALRLASIMVKIPHMSLLSELSARVINVWSCLPPTVNYSTLATFRRRIDVVDISSFLKCDID